MVEHKVASTLNCDILPRMQVKKNKPHSSARKKASASLSTARRAKKTAAKASKPLPKSKAAKKKYDEERRRKKRLELALKCFRWAYEANQRGEFHRL